MTHHVNDPLDNSFLTFAQNLQQENKSTVFNILLAICFQHWCYIGFLTDQGNFTQAKQQIEQVG